MTNTEEKENKHRNHHRPQPQVAVLPWLIATIAPSSGVLGLSTPAPTPAPPPPPPPPLPALVAGDFILSEPTGPRDFRAVGSLLVEVFDEPRHSGDAAWRLFGRTVIERHVTRRYVETARRMAGKKHSLVLAKDRSGGREEVVGMAELGVSSLSPLVVGGSVPPGDEETGSNGQWDVPTPTTAVATVGLLAVSPRARGVGLGRSLVRQCEIIASSPSWGGFSCIYAAVEPDNAAAIRLFLSEGYRRCSMEGRAGTGDGDTALVKILVREGTRTVSKSHVLLRKDLGKEKGLIDS